MAEQNHQIDLEIATFLVDLRARGRAVGTVERYYRYNLEHYLLVFLTTLQVVYMEQLTTDVLRQFLAWHTAGGHTPGGTRCTWRAVKAFINWYAQEMEGAWPNPLRRRMGPQVADRPIPGVSIDELKKMLATCDRSPTGRRDRALLLFMFDTGLRKQELVDLDLGDVNLKEGEVRVRHGKGDKERSVFMGAATTRELLRYLRLRPARDSQAPLWMTDTGKRLTPAGLRQILRRRAARAGLKGERSPHDFRRAFALQCLRNGMDPYTLRRLMGHTSLKVLQVYLNQTDVDLQRTHQKHGPVDNL